MKIKQILGLQDALDSLSPSGSPGELSFINPTGDGFTSSSNLTFDSNNNILQTESSILDTNLFIGSSVATQLELSRTQLTIKSGESFSYNYGDFTSTATYDGNYVLNKNISGSNNTTIFEFQKEGSGVGSITVGTDDGFNLNSTTHKIKLSSVSLIELGNSSTPSITIDTVTGLADFQSNRITNVADPTSNQDVATKNYVDTSVPSAVTPGGSDGDIQFNDSGSGEFAGTSSINWDGSRLLVTNIEIEDNSIVSSAGDLTIAGDSNLFLETLESITPANNFINLELPSTSNSGFNFNTTSTRFKLFLDADNDILKITDATESNILFNVQSNGPTFLYSSDRLDLNGGTSGITINTIGGINVNSNILGGLIEPTLNDHAATKNYVDTELTNHVHPAGDIQAGTFSGLFSYDNTLNIASSQNEALTISTTGVGDTIFDIANSNSANGSSLRFTTNNGSNTFITSTGSSFSGYPDSLLISNDYGPVRILTGGGSERLVIDDNVSLFLTPLIYSTGSQIYGDNVGIANSTLLEFIQFDYSVDGSIGSPNGTENIELISNTESVILRANGNIAELDSSGNFGIGISPSDKLHVAGSIRIDGSFKHRDLSENVVGYIADGAEIGFSATEYVIRSEADLVFATNGINERLRINTSGNFDFNGGFLRDIADPLLATDAATRNYVDSQITTHTHSTSDITSGTFTDARISESSVTQHESVLSINPSQIPAGSFPSGGFTFNGDLTINGDIIKTGDALVIDAELTTTDAVLEMNHGEVGSGVTLGYSGLDINRGTSDNFWFGFDEVRDRFTLGTISALDAGNIASTQIVATRIDSPTDNYLAQWDNTNNRYDEIAISALSINANQINAGTFGSGDYIINGDLRVTQIHGSSSLELSKSGSGVEPVITLESGVNSSTEQKLTFGSTTSIDQLVLNEVSRMNITNPYEFYGWGTSTNVLNYNVPNAARHGFNIGNATNISRTEVFAISGTEIDSYLNLNMNSNLIQNVTDPISNQDAATKKYVDDNSGSGDVTASSNFGTDNSIIVSDGSAKGIKSFGTTLRFDGSVFQYINTVDSISQMSQVSSRSDNTGEARTLIAAGGSTQLKLSSFDSAYASSDYGIPMAGYSSISVNNTNGLVFGVDDNVPIIFAGVTNGKLAELSFTGDWDFQSNILGNIADPVSAQDAATKNYVDLNTSPAGTNLELQYNDNGSFGSSAALTFNDSTAKTLFLTNSGGDSAITLSNVADDSTIKFQNTDNTFFGITGIHRAVNAVNDDITTPALTLRGNISTNTSSTIPAVVIGADNDTNSLSGRPLMGFYNGPTKVAQIENGGNWDFQANRLKNILDPIDAQDIATKNYVDLNSGGDVSINGTPTVNQVATWVDDSTIQGANTLNLTGGITAASFSTSGDLNLTGANSDIQIGPGGNQSEAHSLTIRGGAGSSPNGDSSIFMTSASTDYYYGIVSNGTAAASMDLDFFYEKSGSRVDFMRLDGGSEVIFMKEEVLFSDNATIIIPTNPTSVFAGALRRNGSDLEMYNGGWSSVGGGGGITASGSPTANNIGTWTSGSDMTGTPDLTFDAATNILEIREASSGNDGVHVSNGSNLHQGMGRYSGSAFSFWTESSSSSTSITGIHIRTNLTNVGADSGSTPSIRLSAQRDGNAFSSKPILGGYNHNTQLFVVEANGDWNYNNNDLSGIGALTTSGTVTIGNAQSLDIASEGKIYGNNSSNTFALRMTASNTILSFENHSFASVTSVNTSGTWDYKSNKLTNVADPTSDQDVATKNYVDDQIPSVSSGQYSPSTTNINVVTSTSANDFSYSVVDNAVTVNGKVTILAASVSSNLAIIDIDLPVISGTIEGNGSGTLLNNIGEKAYPVSIRAVNTGTYKMRLTISGSHIDTSSINNQISLIFQYYMA